MTEPTEAEVWVAIIRKGNQYHGWAGDVAGADSTRCGRSTLSRTSARITVATALERGMIPCPRCCPGSDS